MSHPDDDIVSSRGASHGPAGSGRSKGGAKSPSSARRADIDATDPEDDDDMTIFANLKFPPYEFREFPKSVKRMSDGQEKVCNNQKEELEWISALPASGAPAPTAVELERDALAKELAELRAKMDLRDTAQAAAQPELPLKAVAKK